MAYRLGVDLGTTFTAAATLDREPGSSATMVGLGDRALQVPSVLFLQDDGTFLCGEAAERRARSEPERVVREFKRRLGDTVPVLVDGHPFSPQALLARLLASVMVKTTERLGGPPEEVVLTHPATWGDYKRDLFGQLPQLAGLPVLAELAERGRVLTCTEPEAAATRYATRARLRPGDRIAVYDLGGGTFDVCVLERRDDGFAILGTPQGVEHLGGMDVDEALFRHVLGELWPAADGLDVLDPAVTTALASLRRECVEAKEALSADVETQVAVVLPGLRTTVRVTREELEELIRPALGETLTATQRALRSAETTADRLSAVVLVGGGSRIPLVSQLVQSELGIATAMDTHPKHDVALGAALHAATRPGGPAARAGARRRDRTSRASVGRLAGSRRARLGAAAVAAVLGATAVTYAATRDPAGAGGDEDPSPTAGSSTRSPTPADTAAPGGADRFLAGRQVVVVAGEVGTRDLYLVGDGDPRLLTEGGADFAMPSFDPDGQALYYVERSPGSPAKLWRLRSPAGSPESAVEGDPALLADCPTRPAWHPTAPQVALLCLTGQGGDMEVRVVGVTPEGLLRSGAARPLDADVDPSVRSISYTGSGDLVMDYVGAGVEGVYVVRDGGRVERLTAGADTAPAAQPGGDLVVFERDGNLFGLSVDGEDLPCPGGAEDGGAGRAVCRLTTGGAGDAEPAWSPDGTQVLYGHRPEEGAGFELRTLTLEGRQVEELSAPGIRIQGTLAWSSR